MLNEDLAAHSPTYTRTIAHLNKITTDFYETGVAVFFEDQREPCWWKNHRKRPPLLYPTTLSKYLRQVARELKRPYVKVDHFWRSSWDVKAMAYGATREEWFLTVPWRKYTMPLVTSFLLLDPPYFNSTKQLDIPFSKFNSGNANRAFRFAGAEGKEIFEHWLKQCREDPDYRKALRLPPNVTPGGNHDIIGHFGGTLPKHRRSGTRHDRTGRGAHP